jgi:Flp pilus assembly protein TadD
MRRACAVAWVLLLGCGGTPNPKSAAPAASAPNPAPEDSQQAEAADPDDTLDKINDFIAEASTRQAVSEATKPAPSRTLTRGLGDEADRLIALGDAALERGNFEQARQHYRKARRLIPQHPAPVVGIVEARLGLLGVPLEFGIAKGDRRVTELLKLLDEAKKLDESFPRALLLEGQLHLILGEAEAAAGPLEVARRALPGDAEAHSSWAVSRLATGDKAGALEGFAEASRLQPNDPQRLTNLGAAWLMQGEVGEAVAVLERATRLAPAEPRTLGDYGTALLAAGRIDEAIAQLSKAHALAPERATFMSNLCYAEQQRARLAEARSWCEKAVARDPKLGSAWINLATVLAAEKRYREARAALKKAERLDPTDPRVKANLEDLEELGK